MLWTDAKGAYMYIVQVVDGGLAQTTTIGRHTCQLVGPNYMVRALNAMP